MSDAEEKLRDAANTYAYARIRLLRGERISDDERDAFERTWAGLLEAVREFSAVDEGAVSIVHVSSGEYHERDIALLRAKAAVCDAFLAEQGEDYDRAIGRTVKALRALEAKP